MNDDTSDEELLANAQYSFESGAPRHRLFVAALFANGFRTADAARIAGYRNKNLAAQGAVLMRRPDVQAQIKARLAKLEAEDPRFASEAILHEIAETAFMAPTKDTLPSKLRALELLGKWRRLFVDRIEANVTVNPVEDFLLRRHAERIAHN